MKLIYWHKSRCFFAIRHPARPLPSKPPCGFCVLCVFFLLPPLLSVVFLHPSPSPFPFHPRMLLGAAVRAAVFIENEHFSRQRCLCGSFKPALTGWRKLPRHVRRPARAQHRRWVWKLKRCEQLAEIKVRHKTRSRSERRLRFSRPLVGRSLSSVTPSSP